VAARKSSDYGRLFFQAEVFRAGRLAERRKRPDATVTEPAQRVPVFRDCDVLVAGGGPSGTAAAIAAARAGADVVLVERHNHLGGLSTGGLVIWIDRMTGWSGEPVIRGIGEELLDRLPVIAGGTRFAQDTRWRDMHAAVVAGQPAREADQDRRQGRQPRALRDLPDGRGGGVEADVRRHAVADRRVANTARAGMRRAGRQVWRATRGEVCPVREQMQQVRRFGAVKRQLQSPLAHRDGDLPLPKLFTDGTCCERLRSAALP
jgi:glycine/D-amino acid oxidase-like deaminating enzyme